MILVIKMCLCNFLPHSVYFFLLPVLIFNCSLSVVIYVKLIVNINDPRSKILSQSYSACSHLIVNMNILFIIILVMLNFWDFTDAVLDTSRTVKERQKRAFLVYQPGLNWVQV